MSIVEKLTQQQVVEILIDIYNKGHETKNLDVKDIVNEIKRLIIHSVTQTE